MTWGGSAEGGAVELYPARRAAAAAGRGTGGSSAPSLQAAACDGVRRQPAVEAVMPARQLVYR